MALALIQGKSWPLGRVVVDYETDGLHPYDGSRPFLCGMKDMATQVRVLARPNTPQWGLVKKVWETKEIEKICHNGKFERKMSYHSGMDIQGIVHDTMALAVLLDEYQRLSLDALSQRHLGLFDKGVIKEWMKRNTRAFRKENGRDPNYSDVPKEMMEPYLCGDLDKTGALFNLFYERVKADPKLYQLYLMEIDLAKDLAEMEDYGIRVHQQYTEERIKAFEPELNKLETRLHEMAGVRFNVSAPQQLAGILESMGIDTGERTAGGFMKTDGKLLELLYQNEFVDVLLRWRTINKLLGTYLKPFTQHVYGDTMHGSFWQFGKDKAIVTGRLSSGDPNLQNIPGEGSHGIVRPLLRELGPTVRRAIVPPPGHSFIFVDFKQIEMVIFSCLAGDPKIIDFIRKGGDVYIAHGKVAMGEKAFDGLTQEQYKVRRYEAKELTLSLVYGMGIKKFAQKVKLPYEQAKARRDAYFNNSPASQRFMMATMSSLLQRGYVTDAFGRRYHVPKDLAYKAVNALCQGPAATVMKRGIIRARALRALGARPLMTIHDELILLAKTEDVPRILEACTCVAEPVGVFPVPIRIDVKWSSTNWTDKTDYKLPTEYVE